MWSFLSSLSTFSFSSIYYMFLLFSYVWSLLPIGVGSLCAYKFYSLYSTTDSERYIHSKYTSSKARRLTQATSEFFEWTTDCVHALRFVDCLPTIIRVKFGITRKAPPPSAPKPSGEERVSQVRASLQAAAANRSSGGEGNEATIPRTRSIKRYNDSPPSPPQEPSPVGSTTPKVVSEPSGEDIKPVEITDETTNETA